jgi:hypothetical protein
MKLVIMLIVVVVLVAMGWRLGVPRRPDDGDDRRR